MAFLSGIIAPTNVITADTVLTLTNKTLTAPVINSPTGIVKGDVGLGNVDNTSDATKNAATATLTNKTLTAPVIATISNSANTLTLPTSTDTLVGRATTDTLTNKTLTLPIIDNPKLGYTTTATAAGTTTLTVSSNHQQFFTGVTTQTIVMPDVTTLTLGMSYSIENLSTGTLTVQSSGANTINTIPPGLTALCTCNSITGTTAASWDFDYHAFSTITGTGSAVLATSPTLVTPVLGTPSSGTLSSCTVDGTNSVGYLNIPINSKSAAYTTLLADSGKIIFHPSTDANVRTFTIDSNANVAYPLGTALSFINMTANVVTIAITTDTMYLSSAGTTGSRSLAQYGSATAIKMTANTWLISGSGLT